MSVTVRFGAHDDAGSDMEPGRAAAQQSGPAVVYLAAAKSTFGTARYRGAMERVADQWPRAVVMDADACGFASRSDWHLRWPFILDGVDGVVVLAEEDGSMGRDTWTELRDATDSGLPCWFVTPAGDLAPGASVRFRVYPSGARTVRRWAHAEVLPNS